MGLYYLMLGSLGFLLDKAGLQAMTLSPETKLLNADKTRQDKRYFDIYFKHNCLPVLASMDYQRMSTL